MLLWHTSGTELVSSMNDLFWVEAFLQLSSNNENFSDSEPAYLVQVVTYPSWRTNILSPADPSPSQLFSQVTFREIHFSSKRKVRISWQFFLFFLRTNSARHPLSPNPTSRPPSEKDLSPSITRKQISLDLSQTVWQCLPWLCRIGSASTNQMRIAPQFLPGGKHRWCQIHYLCGREGSPLEYWLVPQALSSSLLNLLRYKKKCVDPFGGKR